MALNVGIKQLKCARTTDEGHSRVATQKTRQWITINNGCEVRIVKILRRIDENVTRIANESRKGEVSVVLDSAVESMDARLDQLAVPAGIKEVHFDEKQMGQQMVELQRERELLTGEISKLEQAIGEEERYLEAEEQQLQELKEHVNREMQALQLVEHMKQTGYDVIDSIVPVSNLGDSAEEISLAYE